MKWNGIDIIPDERVRGDMLIIVNPCLITENPDSFEKVGEVDGFTIYDFRTQHHD